MIFAIYIDFKNFKNSLKIVRIRKLRVAIIIIRAFLPE